MPHQKKILLSDNDAAFCMLLTDILHGHGYLRNFLTRGGHKRDSRSTLSAPTTYSDSGLPADACGQLLRYGAAAQGQQSSRLLYRHTGLQMKHICRGQTMPIFQ